MNFFFNLYFYIALIIADCQSSFTEMNRWKQKLIQNQSFIIVKWVHYIGHIYFHRMLDWMFIDDLVLHRCQCWRMWFTVGQNHSPKLSKPKVTNFTNGWKKETFGETTLISTVIYTNIYIVQIQIAFSNMI